MAEAERRGPSMHLLVAAGIYLGLRKAELLALQWRDVDFANKVAHVTNTEHFTTKSGKNRSIPICEELMEIFRKYRRLGGFVLEPLLGYRPNARYRWDCRGNFTSCVIAARLDPRIVTIHILRHTFASIAAQAGVSLYKIGSWMGHSNEAVSALYAHLTAFDEDINRLNSRSHDSPSPQGRITS